MEEAKTFKALGMETDTACCNYILLYSHIHYSQPMNINSVSNVKYLAKILPKSLTSRFFSHIIHLYLVSQMYYMAKNYHFTLTDIRITPMYIV